MYSDNNWYGHRKILADYCCVKDSPLYATLLHGWIWAFKGSRGQRKIKSAPYLTWNKRHLLSAQSLGVENVVSIGAPYLYLDKLMQGDNTNPKRNGVGTLYFPQHSTSLKTEAHKHQLYKDYIESKYPPPYTVSLFFLEPKFDEIKRYYIECGWRVFCAGSRSSEHFLNEVWSAIESNENVVSNDLSTSLFYAAYRGKSVYLDPLSQVDMDDILSRETGEDYKKLIATLCGGISGDSARKLGANELGEEFLLSSNELAKVVGWSDLRRRCLAKLINTLVDLKVGKSVRKGISDL